MGGRLRADDGFGACADAVYEALIRAHAGMDAAESAALHARLVLILAHEVGDLAILAEAIAVARRTLRPDET